MKHTLTLIIVVIGATVMFGRLFAKDKPSTPKQDNKIQLTLDLTDFSLNKVALGASQDALATFGTPDNKTYLQDEMAIYSASGFHVEYYDGKIDTFFIAVAGKPGKAKLQPSAFTMVAPDGSKTKVTDASTLKDAPGFGGVSKKITKHNENDYDVMYSFKGKQLLIMISSDRQYVQLENMN